MDKWTFTRKRSITMKRTCIKSILIFGLAISSGCVGNDRAITWRRDVSPIKKRVKALSVCTNMLWHGEIVTKSSFLSPPGPSTYRVGCFIPNASQIMPSLSDVKFTNGTKSEYVSLLPAESSMLKSEYGIDAYGDTTLLSKQLDNELIRPPCWGQCLYFREKDILLIVFYGE